MPHTSNQIKSSEFLEMTNQIKSNHKLFKSNQITYPYYEKEASLYIYIFMA